MVRNRPDVGKDAVSNHRMWVRIPPSPGLSYCSRNLVFITRFFYVRTEHKYHMNKYILIYFTQALATHDRVYEAYHVYRVPAKRGWNWVNNLEIAWCVDDDPDGDDPTDEYEPHPPVFNGY